MVVVDVKSIALKMPWAVLLDARRPSRLTADVAQAKVVEANAELWWVHAVDFGLSLGCFLQ